MSAAEFQGTVVGVFEGQTKSGKFVVKKPEIESGVVGDQRALGNEAVEFGEDPGGGWLTSEHFVADAVDPSGVPGNRFIDLDKTLEFVAQRAIFNADGTDLYYQITVSG